ncbi:MAG: GMC family oxidoreductase N-terminal domain-containing protein [Polyangiales bacterium]
MASEQVDYVVVGGGSSGSVVAGELARTTRAEVLLLELGDEADAHPETLAADGYKDAFANDALVLERFSEPQGQCGRQRLFLGSGRGMGGSGAINGMVYTRGSREDYEGWPPGWRYDDLVPSFEALEARLRVRPRAATAFTECFVHAAEQAGFRRGSLSDGDLTNVIGYQPMNYEGDARRSSYVAFVRDDPPPSLTVRTGALVRRVVFEGRRAVGVEIEQAGVRRTVRARREVVLCAGALETPKLLMLSGVGPAATLQRFGIPEVSDRAGVGENLHDHPNVTLFFVGKQPVDSFYPQLYGFFRANLASDLPARQSDTCYVMYPARSSLREAAMRMVPPKLPESLYGDRAKRIIRAGIAGATRIGAVERLIERTWGCVVILGKPKSRGHLTLRSREPGEQARIDPAYFAHPEDMQTMLRGVHQARRIAAGASLSEFGNRAVLPPGFVQRDAALRTFIEHNAMTTFHYAGTCRMGDDDAAVVDTSLRVRGVEGLRVADASVTPVTPVSAMNAPSMMIGLRAAALLRESFARSTPSRAGEDEPAPWSA